MQFSKKKLLVVGGGGREHAIAWKLSQSERVEKIFVAPGNGGTHQAGRVIENVSREFRNSSSVIICESGVSFVVVGPEAPLAEGLGKENAIQSVQRSWSAQNKGFLAFAAHLHSPLVV